MTLAKLPDDIETLPPLVAAAAFSSGRARRKRRYGAWYRRRKGRRVLLLLWLLGAIAVVAALQLLFASWQLQQSAARVSAAKESLRAGDVDAARFHTRQAHEHAERAAWGTLGPHLWLMQHAPVAGDDVRALRSVVEVSQELTGPVADQLFDLRLALDPEAIRPVDGQVGLTRFASAGERMHTASERLGAVDDRLATIDLGALAPPLREGVSGFVDEVHRVRAVTEYGDRVLGIVPRLLGAEGPRRYLVVFQNNAELRSTGGIPGAFAVLDADRGLLTMGEQGSVPDLGGRRAGSVQPLTPEENQLFDGKVGRFVQNVNLTPDWPRSGALLAQMWRQKAGELVDGVLTVDPVVLGYILRGTGPVALRDGKIARSDNAVQLLLNQTYLDHENQAAQNDFFEDSARRIFDLLVRGQGDAGLALRGLYDGVREGRGMVWLADAAEQDRIEGGIVAGELRGTSPTRPDIGVYLNDSTATKLDYYVVSRTDVKRDSCTGDGRQRLLVTTTLASHVPPTVADLPRLLVGAPVTGVEGELLTTVMAYGPVGATITDPTIDGLTGAPAYFRHEGHPVVARTVLLRPGQQLTLTWMVETSPGQRGAPMLRTTPGAHSSGVGSVESGPCY